MRLALPERRSLGRTGIQVSRVALGCGNFGGVGSPRHLVGRGLDHDAAFATMDEAVALGIDLFDTSHSYADGASERWIGEWLAARSPETRAKVRIVTKVGNVVSDSGVRPNLSPANVGAQIRGSLERLGLPRVELCMTHAPDPTTPIESTLEGFARAAADGLVGSIGACNVDAALLSAALDASRRLGLPRYEWIQNEYNLLNRRDEARLLALCRERGLGYTPYSPIAGGVLSGKYERGAPPPEGSRLALRPEGHEPSAATFDAIARLAVEASRRGTSTGALALAWVTSRPHVTSAIVGPSRQPEHLRIAREALALDLDETAQAEIAGWFA